MNDHATRLDRRSFIGISLAATAPLFLGRTLELVADEAHPDDDRVLVVIQLSGGNDGLSMVVPYADDAYGRARNTTRVTETIKLDSYHALHAGLAPLQPFFAEGRLAIVEGCSYPNPNRSHFKSMDIWHTADVRGRQLATGWIGRAIDARCPDVVDPNLIINVGPTVPYALRGQVHKPVSFEKIENYTWNGRGADERAFAQLNQPREGVSDLDWLHRVAADARQSSGVLRAAAARYKPAAEYPQERNALASELQQVASLITGGLATRVYYVSMGTFDTHVRQKQAHDTLMRNFGSALAAFIADLRAQRCARRVSVLVFSEFGRRVNENASGGTDHGVAGPMLLLGESIRGGFHGLHPSLTDLDEGDLKMTVDFRQVYASVLGSWLGTDAERVLGAAYEPLPLFQ